MYAVNKNPITITEIVEGDYVSNYVESTTRILDSVPDVDPIYLKWENGDSNNGSLLEMTDSEKSVIDSSILLVAQTKKIKALSEIAINEVMSKHPDKHPYGYMMGVYDETTLNNIKADADIAFVKLTGLKIDVMSSSTVGEVESIGW